MSQTFKKILVISICLLFAGCSAKKPEYISRLPQQDEVLPVPGDEGGPLQPDTGDENNMLYVPEPDNAIQPPSPREQASLSLIEKAISFLDENRPDDTIRVLEQAVNISPDMVENYYYLAEAWIMKGNLSQARENNDLALIYYGNDPDWLYRIEEQKGRIDGLD